MAGDASFLGNCRPGRVFFVADVHAVLTAGVEIAAGGPIDCRRHLSFQFHGGFAWPWPTMSMRGGTSK